MMVVGVSETLGENITSLSAITNSSGNYVITKDITYSSTNKPTVIDFSGTLEATIDPDTHMPYRIKNLSAPLFTTLTGTVKNLVLEDVAITSGDANGNTGAIACNMTGTSTKKAVIYNCGILSGSVSGSGNVGGLVGLLGQGTPASTDAENNNCYARVINCYSFANITGGSEKGGIVGYNSYPSKYDDQRTMVMNCMFYGEIDYTGGTLSPIYGGLEINNFTTGHLNNYNYYRYEALYSINNTKTTTLINKYNCALPAEERFLNRFEFFRDIVNSTRELAAWYATGSVANAHTKMLKWVLDKSIAPYPILKVQGTYPSAVNYDPVYTNDATGKKVPRSSISNTEDNRNKGRQIGTLTVYISESNTTDGGQTKPSEASVETDEITINRTDKDYNNFNFNYDKVQLPYYNEVGTKNCTGNRVVTGWKITSMSKSAGSFTTGDEAATNANGEITSDPYNFADRNCTEKDIYSVSGRVFSQGAYFDVPTGVTSITIEPYWAKCVYLSDPYYDKYISNTSTPTIADVNVTGSARYTNGSSYSINGDDQVVYTKIADNDGAWKQLNAAGEASSTVYDYAVVLVGNYHCIGTPATDRKPFTIMSADLNNDNEPDYSFIFRSGKQEKIAPIRFDFINVPSLSMTHKVGTAENVANNMSIPGNFKNLGWFELTNTCNIRFSQFEMDFQDGTTLKTLSPCILLGGVIDQFVSAAYITAGNTHGDGTTGTDRTQYIHLGSNVCFPNVFGHGAHMNKEKAATHHCPISVTGGDYNLFYLTGYMQPQCPNNDDNGECYISGGRFVEVGGAGYEGIGANNSDKGNIVWQIYYADIDRFFGGGINDKNPVLGNITTVISNSHIGIFCGGPKFGNMTSGKTVKTTANGCTFDNFFGAGYGGTAFVRANIADYSNKVNYSWNTDSKMAATYSSASGSNRRGMYKDGNGIAVSYDYRHFQGGTTNTVGQLFVNYASLSLAQCNAVTSKLTGCTIKENFYGGGSLGKVAGDINSTLTNCTVSGNVFGAGKSATPPAVEVFPASGFSTEPYYNPYTGMFQKGALPTGVEYIWSDTKGSQTNSQSTGTLVDDGDDHWIHTDVNLNDLGVVSGDATLIINGSTQIAGNVFGGGDESAVTGSATVNIED